MTNSPISRIGGKRLLRKAICERFPAADRFDRYIEVFGGAAWVLLYKDKHAQIEVYNDGDGELVNLMRCIKYHSSELQREISGFYNSREIFLDALEQLQCRGFTDIQRAARYFVKMILSISLDTIYTKNFSKFSLLPHKYPRSVSGVDICAGASCGGTQRCMITPPFFSRRHAAYCRADSPIVPITHKVTPNKRF